MCVRKAGGPHPSAFLLRLVFRVSASSAAQASGMENPAGHCVVSFETTPVKSAPVRYCAGEVCAGEVCAGEVCAGEICPAELCAGEVCPGEICRRACAVRSAPVRFAPGDLPERRLRR